VNILYLVFSRLFYFLPLSVRKRIVMNQWSGKTGSEWHSFHYGDRKLQSKSEPVGWENRQQLFEYMLSTEAQSCKDPVFIDYGCGNGLFTSHIKAIFPDHFVFFGFDINKETIKSNRQRFPEIEFRSEHFYKDLSCYRTIFLYFGSTLAYLEFDEIKILLAPFIELEVPLFILATDTVKGEMPVFKSNRNNFAYNYNLECLMERLNLEVIFSTVDTNSYYIHQQIAGRF
jgi:SAM-dependent methyltransferase